jgi:hypothetical protein
MQVSLDAVQAQINQRRVQNGWPNLMSQNGSGYRASPACRIDIISQNDGIIDSDFMG